MDEPPPNPAGPDPAARLLRAKEIFLAVRELGVAEREDAIDRAAPDDPALREQVRALLRGAGSPLPFESLADDIRAAQRTRAGTFETAPLGGRAGDAAGGDGDRIGHYRLLQRIGEGGFGVVFMAEQEKPVRRRVALKIIKLGMDTKQVVARFEAERQALALMDHPSIAKVFDAGATETGRPYFVMELVRGLPITEYCDQKQLGIRERLALAAQVCEALQHAHHRGVIHRDIKPSNVLVSTVEGDKPLTKIIDFGIAKATSARLTEQTIFTEFRQMIGTPEYMSPEQAGESAEDIDTRTDVYAVGVLLYELLTGATPFDSKRLRSAAYGEMQRIIREEDPPKPSTRLSTHTATTGTVATQRATEPSRLARAVQGELDWIVMKALEKDRARRYDSAAAMAADLQRFLTGHAVHAAPPSAAYRARKFIRRNKGAVLAASLLLAALVAGLVGTSVGFINAERRRDEAVRERERAETEKTRADASARAALEAEELATRQAYTANMMSASTSIDAVQYATARASLDAAPERMRGWEWRVLHAKLDSSIRAIPAAIPMSDGPATRFVCSLAPHPDGRSFFSINQLADPAVRHLDLETGRLLRSFPKPGAPSPDSPLDTNAWLSGDGNRLTLATLPREAPQRLSIDVWDTRDGRRLASIEAGAPEYPIWRGELSPKGDRILLSNYTRTWTVGVPSGEVLASHSVNLSAAGVLTYSHDGTVTASADVGHVISVRDGVTLDPLASMPGHSNDILDFSFSPDDRWLGSAADDDTARVWDLAATPPTAIELKHGARVGNIRFSPDSSLVATVSADRAIRVWDRATGTRRATYASESLIDGPLMFMPDGKTVAGQELDGTVRSWDITAEETRVLRGHAFIVGSTRFVPNNPAGIIISGGWDGYAGSTGGIRLWDADTGELIGIHHGRAGDVIGNNQIAVSNDGRFAAIAIQNFEAQRTAPAEPAAPLWQGRTEVLDLTTGELVFSVPCARLPCAVWFAAHSASIITSDAASNQYDAGQLHIVDARSGRTLRTREMDKSSWWSIAISPDGRSLVAVRHGATNESERSKSMLVLDAATLETVREIDGMANNVAPLAFSPDGARFVTGGMDGVLHLHDFSSGRRLASMKGHSGRIIEAAFSPDGSRLASGGLDRKIRIWNMKTFDQVAALGGHEGHIGDLDWDASGERLVSGSGDQTVRIWEPTPIRARIEARAARKAALAIVEPMVAKLFEELKNPARVVERLRAEPSLDALQRKVAMQLVLKRSLDSAPGTPTPKKSRAAAGDDFAT